MHSLKLFPHYRLLRLLIDNSLNHGTNLITAMRRWSLLNWFYGDEGANTYLDLEGGLTFNEWYQEFFKLPLPLKSGHPEGKSIEKIDEILKNHNPQCYCYKTTKDWLLFYNFSVAQWQKNLQRNISISQEIFEEVLNDRLFAKIRKTLQTDINFLKENGCLIIESSLAKKQKVIYRVEKLPNWVLENPDIEFDLSSTELADLAQALDMLTFLDPKLAPIADKISQEVSGTRRVFLHVDYVVPEEIQYYADDLQEKLQDNWRDNEIKPILFNYFSARLGNRECLVYPVCIYYVQRAKYLCAYGLNPDGDVTWYNYRLERIQSEKLLEWSDTKIPNCLFKKYQLNQLPQPQDVQKEMEGVWGFDFHNKSQLMLLRFNDDFHERYIKNTFRHETFSLLHSQKQIAQIIKDSTNSAEETQQILEICQKFSNDAYYTAKYRVNDNNVIMRLRAWGPNVEVLLPTDLRTRMAKDIQETWKLYQGCGSFDFAQLPC
jgi:CRISPR-associated protein (TIGR03985 family)